ncbi:target of Myb1 membrane trafficking protein-like isoform X3 [Mercenaria mercenaria]|uniref:target of Myb1 membrane trafficking protein-like isoform X3 n=1 Tax=Mercenaria mercenaria TaxID=6596 RepID=UPI00234F93F8|nr:target of Myb1 membrane trafficking protein-like isoform X3 [Mercenaria mercenaria]
MAALFGHGNPLATPVGQLIEKATDGTQPSENWALYMEVCDRINETDEGPKDAGKAFRKRLSQNMGKNHTAVLYTLTCLETCVKNCGRRFHIQIANKDFLNDMVKVIGPKYDPPQALQEKVLSMIQTWADAFRGSPDMKDVEKVYQDLKAKGIEFPMTDLDNLAPIHTPARTQGGVDPEPLSRSRGSTTNRATSVRNTGQVLSPAPVPVVPQPSGGPVIPSQEQLAKLRSELDVVQGNVRVMSEMLTELSPSNVDSSDLELLQELNRTNRQMQQRIVELLDGIPNEEVTNELLRVNDDLNNVFLRYERFERYRTGQTGQTQDVEPASADSVHPPSYNDIVQPENNVQVPPENASVGNLIDLGDDTTTTTTQVADQMAKMNVNGAHDDFDMFAQSRKSFDQNKENMGSGTNYVNEDQFGQGTGVGQAVNMKAQTQSGLQTRKLQDKETDYDEMEQWLKQHEEATGAGKPEEPISSSEFDKFLSDRASAASTLPSISAQTGAQQNRRQLQKDDDDNPMFAL